MAAGAFCASPFVPPQSRYARQLPQGDANPLRLTAFASSPEGGAFTHLPVSADKAPPLGGSGHARSAALSQKAALQMPLTVTTPPVKMRLERSAERDKREI